MTSTREMTLSPRKLTPVVLGVVVGLLAAVPFVRAAAVSDAVRQCGGQDAVAAAEVSLDRAQDLWRVLPAMLQAPELELDKEPATLVVFDGPFSTEHLQAFGNGKKPEVLLGVVCVIQADGTVNIYHDVDRAGSSLGD